MPTRHWKKGPSPTRNHRVCPSGGVGYPRAPKPVDCGVVRTQPAPLTVKKITCDHKGDDPVFLEE